MEQERWHNIKARAEDMNQYQWDWFITMNLPDAHSYHARLMAWVRSLQHQYHCSIGFQGVMVNRQGGNPHLHLVASARNRFPKMNAWNIPTSKAEAEWHTIANRTAEIQIITSQEQQDKVIAYIHSQKNQPQLALAPCCRSVHTKIKKTV